MLTIAIPTYRNYRQLFDCLYTLTKYVQFPFRICVINNGPERDRDGNRFEDILRAEIEYPELQVLQAKDNLGWQGAINWAFQEAPDDELFCMANDDLVFLPFHRSFLRHLAQYFKFPEVGAVGPSSNYVMGSQSIFDHRGWAAFETTLLIGFFMIVRSSVFSEIGGLDPHLPGGDDLDLSIRIRKAGYKLLVDRTCYVHHIGAQTGARLHPDYWNSSAQIETSNNYLIWKHGVRTWYECASSRIAAFEPITQTSDEEGDLIRAWVKGLETGVDIGCGGNKTVNGALGVDKTPSGVRGIAGGQMGVTSAADLVADASNIPLPDHSQDYVIARHSFEHLLDPLRALHEWRRLLKPGGVLAIACPDQDKLTSMLVDYTHLHAYNPESLKRLLESQGFSIQECVRITPGFSFVLKAVPNYPVAEFEWRHGSFGEART